MKYNNERFKDELLNQIVDKDLKFKYFITIDYHYKCKDYNKVLLDNKHLRKSIRKFYKDDIRMWIFIEQHTDPVRNNYGGYHRHILIEDVQDICWKESSSALKTFLLELHPESMFSALMNQVPSERIKMKLLEKVIRGFNKSVPNGYLALNIKPINDIEGLVGYCTKQVDRFHPAYEVIDTCSSDVNPRPLLVLDRSKYYMKELSVK